MTRAITYLDPIPSSSERAARSPDDYLPIQAITHQIAFEADGWGADRSKKIQELFDALAPEWHTRGGEDRLRPTVDAFERGRVPRGGTALEIGSGTGLQTPVLLDKFDFVVSVDLAAEMLALSPRRDRVELVRADAAALPLLAGSADVIVCVNAFVFPMEYGRVLAPGGRIVFVTTSGDQTPIYLSPDDVVASLEPALGPVDATSSGHGFGTWTVVTRRTED
ncbi:MAG: methyltransferase domain-containing protein [Acidimicrobiales bacterium]